MQLQHQALLELCQLLDGMATSAADRWGIAVRTVWSMALALANGFTSVLGYPQWAAAIPVLQEIYNERDH